MKTKIVDSCIISTGIPVIVFFKIYFINTPIIAFCPSSAAHSSLYLIFLSFSLLECYQ